MNDNKLIAEFMGLEFSKGEYYRPLYNSGDWIPQDELQYHISWDWLIPVVERLFDDEYNEFDGADDLSFRLNDTLLEVNLDSLYSIVVEFIKQQKL